MYLISKTAYIQQILPPHWRGSWREIMLKVLLAPLFSLERQLINVREELIEDINMSAQMLVLDQGIKNITNSKDSYIYDKPFRLEAHIPQQFDKAMIYTYIQKYLPSGVTLEIIYLNS